MSSCSVELSNSTSGGVSEHEPQDLLLDGSDEKMRSAAQRKSCWLIAGKEE